ncbi:uncharacterized protein LOC130647735 [Hydractinia symbiolongicarpus]|uniref:uncharacterized protein LOC130647735 n=1 Tax=Hydractinia symbiolongicarpus TaxID=13093 RepID=UPI0025506E64|nr:uncharacterized protein LOC130647735 [Hydractinia symbiolongicarpus]
MKIILTYFVMLALGTCTNALTRDCKFRRWTGCHNEEESKPNNPSTTDLKKLTVRLYDRLMQMMRQRTGKQHTENKRDKMGRNFFTEQVNVDEKLKEDFTNLLQGMKNDEKTYQDTEPTRDKKQNEILQKRLREKKMEIKHILQLLLTN